MTSQEHNYGTSRNQFVATSEEINLYRVWRVVARFKTLAITTIAVSLSIAILIALLSPRMYRATVFLIPASTNSSSQLGSLGNLASIAGIDISGNEPEKIEAIENVSF